jgi:hypothetical protein
MKWDWNKFANMAIAAIICLSIVLSISILISPKKYEEGYRDGQINVQKGIVEWKLEAGQVWHLEIIEEKK